MVGVSAQSAAGVQSVRHAALDVLRGIAILGTLGTNIWIFTNPAGLVGYIERQAEPGGAWLWAERVLQQLAQGKFLGLLTIMFGVGLAIQQTSAQRRGLRWPGPYPWRAALLFLDGLLHFLLVAEFDVLMGYAVTGAVVAFVLATGDRTQRRWIVGAATLHGAMLTLVLVGLIVGSGGRQDPEPLDPNPYATGSFLDLIRFRLDHLLLFRLEPLFIFPMSIALFLAGARLYRAGVLAPEGARVRRALMIAGFGIAAPVDLVAGTVGGDAVLLTRYGTAPIVALGLFALVAECYVRRPRVGWAGRRLSEIGRMALSCYIMQNLVASTLCYGWGFGLAQRFSPDGRVAGTVVVYACVAVVITASAHLWLRRFDRGPVEWAWNASYRFLTARTVAAGR
ncbi:MAG: DUF418 domain-containing protein [Mycobacteriaceae bacterium]|nr:DUF418 domain-containing protein [Mycobacteriaceae bacterium]